MNFDDFFTQATSTPPYAYQRRLALDDPWPEILEAPTGAGKTEAIVLAWLWRRRHAAPEVRRATPRRLAYCLPMRVLVEQTRDRVKRWLEQLGGGAEIKAYILMGGEQADDWDLYPEREAILIGTQDMLLSRALNRGYAVSRARWPMPYGLLNNDCLWVFDEVQLMGNGLATTAQLAAFREKFGAWGHCPSLWVSATLRPEWLSTVDWRAKVAAGLTRHALAQSEWKATDSLLTRRLEAKKLLTPAKFTTGEPKKLADEIRTAHQPETLTLVVLNTVKKALAVYEALTKPAGAPTRNKKDVAKPALPLPAPEILLLHSRFRPPERQAKMKRLLQLAETGGIVIATQVVEAGVDISARTLFTELSPWASFVQRVGRCNRKGEFEQAQVFWVDMELDDQRQAAKNAPPYAPPELLAARKELSSLEDVGPRALRDYLAQLPEERQASLYLYEPESVIRRRTVEELFDTTPDLTDADLDVSVYIRENDEHDVYVFWRMWEGDNPNQPQLQPAPSRNELCPAPLNMDTLAWLDKHQQERWRWDFLESRWQRVDRNVPGQTYLLRAEAGGYSIDTGFEPTATEPVTPLGDVSQSPEGNDSDPYSTGRKIWQTIAAHTNQVVEELENLLAELATLLTPEEVQHLRHAARWHDWGKAYAVFQEALTSGATPDFPLPDEMQGWGKSSGQGARYAHPGFRHELASAVGMVALGHSDLACYLTAAHHGKVRLSIRSLPTEKAAPGGRRFARGVWEGDRMPRVKLGGGVIAPEITFSLALMELGLSENGQPSWAERALALREQYGPFRLAYLETLLCAADRRASANPRPEVSND